MTGQANYVRSMAVALVVATILSAILLVICEKLETDLRRQRLALLEDLVSAVLRQGSVPDRAQLAKVVFSRGLTGVALVDVRPKATLGHADDHLRTEVVLNDAQGAEGGGTVVAIRWLDRFAAIGSRLVYAGIGLIYLIAALTPIAFASALRLLTRPLTRQIADLEGRADLSLIIQGLAHDLRRPLGHVRMLLRRLAELEPRETLSDLRGHTLPQIERSLSRGERLVDDLVLTGRRLAGVKEAVGIPRLVAQALNEAVATQKNRGDVTIETSWRHSRDVEGDGAALLRLLSNLVSNALEAQPRGGRLWFHTRDAETRGQLAVEVVIGNSDSYIPPETVARLFRPYSTVGKAEGTGLGLLVCLHIVREHGGTISVRSDPEVGTEFVATLPARAGAPAEPAPILPSVLPGSTAHRDSPGPSDQKPSSGPRVFVVEDDPFTLDFYRASLAGITVEAFASPSSLLTALEKSATSIGEHDVVIVDYFFAGSETTGGDLAVQLRRRYGALVVLATDSRDVPADELAAVDAVVSKDEVGLALLERLLAKRMAALSA